ncbi:MAG: hypothetical protein J6O61_12920 [Butyrivibrio sp.]|uniref:DUF6492 family protein n=1 Tax=Butyrivibrio sp. TaxID=28121 RepID=UPI001B18DC48|nr:DUF6492 family protein [Butyrivibrio sp.]MBO6241721.1 hypothetical protein [Butyrivibrio sp.]
MKQSRMSLLFPCVIPTIVKDYQRMRLHYNRFFKFLPIDRIIFVGPENLLPIIESDKANDIFTNHSIEFINETSLLDIDPLRPVFNSLITPENNLKPTAINWYYQQFLKMSYALICKSPYYLCWDSDTLPLKKIEMFNSDGKPYFDIKSEHNEVYFKTIEKLFGFGKIIEKSFVSEHMLFKVDLMKEMLSEIERTDFSGEHFSEKILYAVGSENLNQGFSEFETFGSWVGVRHSSEYKLRNWNSFRNTNFFVDISDVSEEDLNWLSKDFDAATFEKYQETNTTLNTLFKDSRYRENLTPKQFYTSILESGVFGDYIDGSIKDCEFSAPL